MHAPITKESILYSRERERVITIMRLIAIKLITNKETLTPEHNSNHQPWTVQIPQLGLLTCIRSYNFYAICGYNPIHSYSDRKITAKSGSSFIAGCLIGKSNDPNHWQSEYYYDLIIYKRSN